MKIEIGDVPVPDGIGPTAPGRPLPVGGHGRTVFDRARPAPAVVERAGERWELAIAEPGVG